MMTLIHDELDEINRCCENVVPGSKVVAAVPAMVRIEIERTAHKKIVCCLMFPQDYPNYTILMELKSKTLSDKLLSGLTKLPSLLMKTLCAHAQKKYQYSAPCLVLRIH